VRINRAEPMSGDAVHLDSAGASARCQARGPRARRFA